MRGSINLLFPLLLLSGCGNLSRDVGNSCHFNVQNLEDSIKRIYDADSVVIYVRSIQEELYFPRIKGPAVVIFNPNTKVINFKALSNVDYKDFNIDSVEEQLRLEGFPIAAHLASNCNLNEFNEIIVEYKKIAFNGIDMYRYIVYYGDSFKVNKNIK